MIFKKLKRALAAGVLALVGAGQASAALVTYAYEAEVDSAPAGVSHYLGETLRVEVVVENDPLINPNWSAYDLGAFYDFETATVSIAGDSAQTSYGYITLVDGESDSFSVTPRTLDNSTPAPAPSEDGTLPFGGLTADFFSLDIAPIGVSDLFDSLELPAIAPEDLFDTIIGTNSSISLYLLDWTTDDGRSFSVNSSYLLSASGPLRRVGTPDSSATTVGVAEPATLSLLSLCLGLIGWARKSV